MQQLRILTEAVFAGLETGLLLAMAREDVKDLTVSGAWIRDLFLVCTLRGLLLGSHTVPMLLALVPGMLLLLSSCRGSLGLGDALVFLALGMTLDPELTAGNAILAVFPAGGYGLCLCFTEPSEGRKELAFLPWIAAGNLVCRLIPVGRI